MGKYMRKCKGIGEVAVMEVAQVGVRTRARASAMAAATAISGPAKRRKVAGGELRFSSSYVRLRSRRRRVMITPENSVSPAVPGNHRRRSPEDRCSSPSSDQVPASCCSSNGSSERVQERMEFVDPEDESVEVETATYFDCRERRETTPSSELHTESDELESTAKASEASSRPRSRAEKMPSKSEIEEFFGTAEKDLQKQFAEKYNYDFVKDVPLEGRYEWVRLKP